AVFLDFQHISLIRSIIGVINHLSLGSITSCKAVKLADGVYPQLLELAACLTSVCAQRLDPVRKSDDLNKRCGSGCVPLNLAMSGVLFSRAEPLHHLCDDDAVRYRPANENR